MKKFISLICTILILASIGITGYATNVDAIAPDGYTKILGVTDTEIPINGTLPNYHAGEGTTVIIVPNKIITAISAYDANSNTIITTGTTQATTNNTTTNYNTVDTAKQEVEQEGTALPKDDEQAVDYHMDVEKVEKEIFDLTNAEREKAGLNALIYNIDLQAAADLRAKEIATLFSHTRPNGTDCHTVVADFDYYVTGENLIMADNPISEPAILVDSWMNSEGHRANILLPEYTSMAVGLYVEDDITYAIQIFMG